MIQEVQDNFPKKYFFLVYIFNQTEDINGNT